MPLVSILDDLKKAQAGQYAVPLFDTFDMMATQGILNALEEKQAPGILGVPPTALDGPEARGFIALVRTMAQDASMPVSLMLDHGSDFEHCVKALALGFSDVMYDGSRLPLEENIANTRLVVRAAHAVGASVEAELGHVGRGDEYQSFGARRHGFTDPNTVERFVAETGVDSLAVAVGTAHGLYDGEPKLALDLLDRIRERIDVPLVLHGGSGLSDEQLRAAIRHGIDKVNLFTFLTVSAKRHVLEAIADEGFSYFDVIRAVSDGFQEECERLLDVLGASGRGRVRHTVEDSRL
jgi:fructose-bisphosphate aldolase class II